MAENPLNSFYRRAKFKLDLPSRGRWYPKSVIAPTVVNGSVDVMPMTANDEAKFKVGDAGITGNTTYEIIKSCIPEIKQPDQVPMCDLDAILLAVRAATYGDEISFTVKVPETNLTRKLDLKISDLLTKHFGQGQDWDESIKIIDETTGKELNAVVKPMNLRTLFSHTKNMIRLQQFSNQLAQAADVNDDDKIERLNDNIVAISQVNVNMLIDSIVSIAVEDYTTSNPVEIRNFISQIDIEYFKALQKHVDEQRRRLGLQIIFIDSTDEEKAAGAPERWEAEINFTTADFFNKG